MNKLYKDTKGNVYAVSPIQTPREGWVAMTEAEVDAHLNPAPSPEAILETMRKAIQAHLDTKPKERLYDGILSLCTYATSTNPKFAAEGQAGVAWRDACWAKGYEIMAEVQAGTRDIPTVEELLAELPVFRWPDDLTGL